MDYNDVKDYLDERLERELPHDLYYHGIHHTRNVLHATELLAKAENVSGDELVLVMTAALFHDAGFLVQYEANEPVGCDFARSILPEYNYSTSQIEHICEMIMATEIPQSPKDHLGKILCDADLNYLGTDAYYPIAETLKRELMAYGRTFDRQQWITFQLGFMKVHSYFTEAATKLYGEKKLQHLDELNSFFKFCLEKCEGKVCPESGGILTVCMCRH